MNFSIPNHNQELSNENIKFLLTFVKECRRSIIKMVKNSQSGHPGGSLSALDILATLYAFRLTKTNEKVVISNGHISPAIYSVLGECGAVEKQDAIKNFRKFGSNFEGHITRHINGVWYGTGPLGTGISAATGFAWTEKQKSREKNKSPETVFGMVGDGEMQEGQVHEMALFANKEKLDNFCVFVDWNRVQLSDSLAKTMPINPIEFFLTHNWEVIEIDGHNFAEIWEAINRKNSGKPRAIVARTIMGYGVKGMVEDGEQYKSTWHGNAPKPEMADEMLKNLGELSQEEKDILNNFRKSRKFEPKPNEYLKENSVIKDINIGNPHEYLAEDFTDCRSAYGNALADLAEKNSRILGMTADLGGSVKTNTMLKKTPNQHIEFGICEQNMVSSAGGMSLNEFIPFCSTFGAFMTSRAKDQARVNDINCTNVKMVSTHCGLSVGEDGPTHQAIDDSGSMLGLLHTMPLEPADPNHCDRIIRYIAKHYGNFYVRMGRAKLKTLLKENGEIFYDKNYKFIPGKCDLFREGKNLTIIATGASVHEALIAREKFTNPEKVEIIIASSIKKFDENLKKSLEKTQNILTVEDHNAKNGLASQISLYVLENNLRIENFAKLSVQEYQLSGKVEELYKSAKIDSRGILHKISEII